MKSNDADRFVWLASRIEKYFVGLYEAELHWIDNHGVRQLTFLKLSEFDKQPEDHELFQFIVDKAMAEDQATKSENS